MITFEEAIRPAFGSPGGKRDLAKTIVSFLPEHEKYVEPFIGGGAVFFAKKPSPQEFINDKDSEIAHAFTFIQGMAETDVSQLSKRKTTFSRDHFFRLRDSNPTSALDRFYKFMYTMAFSFGNGRTSTVKSEEGIGIRDLAPRFDRAIRIVKPRLEGVTITNQDFRELIKKHNGENTFFYLDPPYPTQQGKLKTDLTTQDVSDAVKTIKGKFILSLPNDDETRRAFKEFYTKRVTVRRTMDMKSAHNDPELLISNFELKKSNLFEAEDLFSQLTPKLKLDDVDFLMNRLRHGQEALVVSGQSRASKSGVPHYLVKDDNIIATVFLEQESKAIDNIYSLGRRQLGLSESNRKKAFQHKGLFFVSRLLLKEVLEFPKKL